jgi:hypothetical protein
MNFRMLFFGCAVAVVIASCNSSTQDARTRYLAGEWILDSSTVTPAYLPSFCKELYNGSRFVFDRENQLTVYPDTSHVKCNMYSYHSTGDELHLTEWDMVVTFPLVVVDQDHIILENTHIPYERRTEDRSLDDVHVYRMYLHRK